MQITRVTSTWHEIIGTHTHARGVRGSVRDSADSRCTAQYEIGISCCEWHTAISAAASHISAAESCDRAYRTSYQRFDKRSKKLHRTIYIIGRRSYSRRATCMRRATRAKTPRQINHTTDKWQRYGGEKLKIPPEQFPRSILADTPDILARML